MRRIDERLIAGEPVAEEPELTSLVATLRSMADAPAPLPTPDLERVLRDGVAHEPQPLRPRRGRPTGTLGKIAVGTVVAIAIASGAAALELPASVREPARSVVSSVAELLTPWGQHRRAEQPEQADDPIGPREPAQGPSGVTGPDGPGRPDQPGSDQPGRPDQPGSDQPGRPDQPGSDQPGRPDQPGSDQPGRPDQPGSVPPGTDRSDAGQGEHTEVTPIRPPVPPRGTGAEPGSATDAASGTRAAGTIAAAVHPSDRSDVPLDPIRMGPYPSADDVR